MRAKLAVIGLAIVAMAAAALTLAEPGRTASAQDQAQSAAKDTAALIKRGEYLANGVAMCVICHSPKGEDGLPIKGREFEGGIIPAKPTLSGMNSWAEQAPALRTLAYGAEADIIELLQTGVWPRDGKPLRLPMPPFSMSEEDARAIVLYLQSLEH